MLLRKAGEAQSAQIGQIRIQGWLGCLMRCARLGMVLGRETEVLWSIQSIIQTREKYRTDHVVGGTPARVYPVYRTRILPGLRLFWQAELEVTTCRCYLSYYSSNSTSRSFVAQELEQGGR